MKSREPKTDIILYLEEMMENENQFGQKCITKYKEKSITQKRWLNPPTLSEKQVKNLENYEAIAGREIPTSPPMPPHNYNKNWRQQ